MYRCTAAVRCRLARHSTGLKALGYTFQKSYKELGLLSMFIMIALLVFASLVYYLEHPYNSKFSSIPTAAWCAFTFTSFHCRTMYIHYDYIRGDISLYLRWAIITMTTVGYGDM